MSLSILHETLNKLLTMMSSVNSTVDPNAPSSTALISTSNMYTLGGIASLLALLFGSAALISKYYIPMMDLLRFGKPAAVDLKPENTIKFKPESFKVKTEESLKNMDMTLYWYPVALSSDIKITDTKAYTIKLLGEPLVLYRLDDGSVQCTLDLCPHRSAKLSTGQLTTFNGKRSLECAYHGWRFAEKGQCVRVPSVSSERMGGLCKTIKAESRETFEFAGMVWVWPNKTVKANTDLIPRELFREDCMEDDSKKPYIMVEKARDIPCHYSLVLENLLDFAHLDFTHDGTLGKRAKATQIKADLIMSKNIPDEDETRNKFPKEMQWDKSIHQDSFTYRITRPEFEKVGLKKEFANITSFIPPCFVRLENTDYVNGPGSGPSLSQIFCMIPTGEKEHKIIFRFYTTIPVLNYLNKIPFIHTRLMKSADTILDQDLELLFGISENVTQHGAKVFSKIVNADSAIKAYRDWEGKMLKQKSDFWFKGWETPDIEDLM